VIEREALRQWRRRYEDMIGYGNAIWLPAGTPVDEVNEQPIPGEPEIDEFNRLRVLEREAWQHVLDARRDAEREPPV
jgi:hypothetical protein